MRPLLLLLAACVPYEDHELVAPKLDVDKQPFECHIQASDAALSWPGVTDAETLLCTAKNAGLDVRAICAQPYVGVLETGAIYTSHDAACSEELSPGSTDVFAVALDMRRELCRNGCLVHVFAEDAPAEAVVAFARHTEEHALVPGRDRPSVRECDAVLDSWEANPAFAAFTKSPDAMRLACLGMSRAGLGCLRAAPSPPAAVACR
jgi:hypothetical protein